MADQTSSLRIVVSAEGAEQINALGQSFRQITTTAGARPRAATPFRGADLERQSRTTGEQLGEAFGRNVVAPTLKAPFAAVQTTAGIATRSLVTLGGPLAKMGVAAVG